LCFNVNQSKALTDAEKLLVTEKACNKINQSGILRVVSQTERSQYQNKLKATEKFLNLIKKALTPVVKRVPTKNSEASINKRLHQKKIHSEKKILRKNITE
jgi:ribosome-associated protein